MTLSILKKHLDDLSTHPDYHSLDGQVEHLVDDNGIVLNDWNLQLNQTLCLCNELLVDSKGDPIFERFKELEKHGYRVNRRNLNTDKTLSGCIQIGNDVLVFCFFKQEMKMAKLENWFITGSTVTENAMHDPYLPPEMKIPVVYLGGIVYGHRDFPDGSNITTSQVVSSTPDGFVVTKSGSMYELGEVMPEYETGFPKARERLFKQLAYLKNT